MIEFYLFQIPIPMLWLAAGITIAGTEFLFPSDVSMWSGLAAAIVALLIWTGLIDEYAWEWQFFWFALFSIALILLWFFVIKKYTNWGKNTVDEHRDVSLFDLKGKVTERIEPFTPGTVELFNPFHGIKKWKAESQETIEEGATISVQDADGIKLVVKKIG